MWLNIFGGSRAQELITSKRQERQAKIADLKEYQQPLSAQDKAVLDKPAQEVVDLIRKNELSPREVLLAYGKQALAVQNSTNCLTEIFIRDAEKQLETFPRDKPLSGFPVSLKDSTGLSGHDATTGYASLIGKKVTSDQTFVKLLRDAGAIFYVKTNLPTTMWCIDGANDVWGQTTNPYSPLHSPGGSTSGEGALIGGGGSRLGVGSDIGGSVRTPAANCGICSLRMSTSRFPNNNDVPRLNGNEGMQCVTSPMTKTLGDLRFFITSIFSMKPWEYDYSALQLPWRTDAKLPDKPKIGVLRHNGLLDLTPAVERCLDTTVDALVAKGYEVIDFKLPRPGYEYHRLAKDLYEADGYKQQSAPLMKGENNEPYVGRIHGYSKWPRWLLRSYEWIVRYVFRNPLKADELRAVGPRSTDDYFALIRKREAMRLEVWELWKESGIDFLISPPAASPALRIGTKESFDTILYCSLWNLLNYPSGILPVTRVDKIKDALPAQFSTAQMHPFSRISFESYDAEEMEGLPLAIQVSGLHERDEEVLLGMELVQDALHSAGVVFTP